MQLVLFIHLPCGKTLNRGLWKGCFRDTWETVVNLYRGYYPDYKQRFHYPSRLEIKNYFDQFAMDEVIDYVKLNRWLHSQEHELGAWKSQHLVKERYAFYIGGSIRLAVNAKRQTRNPVIRFDHMGVTYEHSGDDIKRALKTCKIHYDRLYGSYSFKQTVRWNSSEVYYGMKQLFDALSREAYSYEKDSNEKWLARNFPIEHFCDHL